MTQHDLERLALMLGSRPTEILIVLVVLCAALAFAAPRLAGWAFRLVRPLLQKAGQAAPARRLRRRWPHIFDSHHEESDAQLFLLLYSIVALGATLAFSTIFGFIAVGLLQEPRVQILDDALARSLRAHATAAEILFFSSVTHLAGVWANYLWGAVVTLLLLLRRNTALVQVWLTGLLGSGLLIGHLKAVFARPRPLLENPIAFESTHSFPSGHAISSVLLYSLLAYVVLLSVPRAAARPLVFVTLVLGASIGMSRLVLGVHYPSDVLAGWAVGAAWTALLLGGAEYRRRRALLLRGRSDKETGNPPEEGPI